MKLVSDPTRNLSLSLLVRFLQVVPVFAGGLDFSLPVRKFFYDPLGSGKAFVDCVVSLTGFALVGGPARQDAPKVTITTYQHWMV